MLRHILEFPPKNVNIIVLNILLYLGLSRYLFIPIFLMRISVAFKEYDVIISNKSNAIGNMCELSFKCIRYILGYRKKLKANIVSCI